MKRNLLPLLAQVLAVFAAVFAYQNCGQGFEPAAGTSSEMASLSSNLISVRLEASPSSIQPGSSTDLIWSSANATECTASGGWSGSQPVTGRITISPTQTTEYSLACIGAGEVAIQKTTVNVASTAPGAAPFPTITISASPTSIMSGATSTVTWSSTDATTCTASGGWTGTKASSGSEVVSPTASNTYALSCTGSGGLAAQSTVVNVTAPPAPSPNTVTISIEASATSITAGKTVTLSWSAANATTCSALGSWSGTKPVSGTLAVAPLVDSTYVLSCTGPTGTSGKAVSIKVADMLFKSGDEISYSCGGLDRFNTIDAMFVINLAVGNINNTLADVALSTKLTTPNQVHSYLTQYPYFSTKCIGGSAISSASGTYDLTTKEIKLTINGSCVSGSSNIPTSFLSTSLGATGTLTSQNTNGVDAQLVSCKIVPSCSSITDLIVKLQADITTDQAILSDSAKILAIATGNYNNAVANAQNTVKTDQSFVTNATTQSSKDFWQGILDRDQVALDKLIAAGVDPYVQQTTQSYQSQLQYYQQSLGALIADQGLLNCSVQ